MRLQVIEGGPFVKSDARRTRSDHNGPKYQARRDQILDTAVAAFRYKGYAGTSTQDIARALHMTKGSLYYYFRDKEDILFSCHERALDHLLAGARAVRRRHRDPEAALRELIERHVGIMVHEFRGTALALEVATLNGSRHDHIVRRRDQYEGILRDVIEEGVGSGAFRPVDPRLATFAFLGAINWMARWYREGGGRSAEEIGRTFADLFVGSLQPPRPPTRAGRPSVPPPGRRGPAPSRRTTRGGPP
jgi:AcrR family transcriptional regulator